MVRVDVPEPQLVSEGKMEGKEIDLSVAIQIEGVDRQRVKRQYLRLMEPL